MSQIHKIIKEQKERRVESIDYTKRTAYLLAIISGVLILFGLYLSILPIDTESIYLILGLITGFSLLVLFIYVFEKKAITIMILDFTKDRQLIQQIEDTLFKNGMISFKVKSISSQKDFKPQRQQSNCALVVYDTILTKVQKELIGHIYSKGHTIRWLNTPPKTFNYPALKKLPYDFFDLYWPWIGTMALMLSPVFLMIYFDPYYFINNGQTTLITIYLVSVYIVPMIVVYVLRKKIIKRSVKKSRQYKNCKHIKRILGYKAKRKII